MPAYQIEEHRYTDRDVRENPRLFHIATWYAKNYMGDFEFMKDMKEYVQLGHDLNVSQVRAVMNSLRNDPHMASRVPNEIAYAAVPDHKFEEEENVVPIYKARSQANQEVHCGSDVSHKGHWYYTPETIRKQSLCPGVPYKLNREREAFSYKVRVKAVDGQQQIGAAKFTRARSSGLIHKVETRLFESTEIETDGYISWDLKGIQHEEGYGVPTLFVYVQCSTGLLQMPALYREMPDFKELKTLLGIESRPCKKCFAQDQES